MMRDSELRQQLQSSTQRLMRKEAELSRAEETIRRGQQQIQDMVNEQLALDNYNESLLTYSIQGETIRSEQAQIQEMVIQNL